MNWRLWYFSSARHKIKRQSWQQQKQTKTEFAGSHKYQKADNYIYFVYYEHVKHLIQDQNMFTHIHFRWASILRSPESRDAQEYMNIPDVEVYGYTRATTGNAGEGDVALYIIGESPLLDQSQWLCKRLQCQCRGMWGRDEGYTCQDCSVSVLYWSCFHTKYLWQRWPRSTKGWKQLVEPCVCWRNGTFYNKQRDMWCFAIPLLLIASRVEILIF